jgi:segregation and condensation protein A
MPYSVKTDSYEGPFEVLLDLIEARKLLVNDLALANITEDFIAHARAQEAFPLEETANFIQIAATLLLIKSKSLIPDLELTDEEDADVEDLKRR